MAIHIYDVFDSDGYKVNSILIDDRIVDTYWPGYGAKLLDRGPAPVDPTPPPPPAKDPEFGVLALTNVEPMQTGDKIDFKTGIVTKKPEPEPESEPVGDEAIKAAIK